MASIEELNQCVGYADTPAVPLDRIGTCADRVERLGSIVKQFCDRFYNGETVKAGTGNDALRAVPSGYSGQIERLNDAINFLDSAVQTLGSIG